MAEALREIITERDTLQSLREALDDHEITLDQIVTVLPFTQYLHGVKPSQRLRVLYRSEGGSHADA